MLNTCCFQVVVKMTGDTSLCLFVAVVLLPGVFGQEAAECFGAGSVAGAAIGAFLAALVIVAVAYYVRKLYLKKSKGKHLVFSTDPESVKDEFAFDNPGFRQEEARQGWQHEAPTLPMGGKNHAMHVQFTKPEALANAVSKDDLHLERVRTRRVKLWARDFTGLGLKCGGGAREGVKVHSVLKSGPAAAAGLRPGDKIKSIRVEFTGTPLEDAVGIISLASPYPVELEVIEGGRNSEEGRGAGQGTRHPLLKRAGSTGDVNTLEKEARLLHPPTSPNTSHSNNSTLETKSKGGIKKIITEKIITTTLERNKKEKKEGHTSTLERENEKNSKLANKPRLPDVPVTSKPDKIKGRNSLGTEIQIIQPENGILQIEHSEVQKREYDPKRGMKFGIKVLPPNIPDDGVLKHSKSVENGVVTVERKSSDEIDKPSRTHTTQIRHESEIEPKTKPVVAKRREKMAPPIPNARVRSNDSDVSSSQDNSKSSDSSRTSSFARTDLNSSGLKRDENGIPQELPQHMFNAARAARINRKSATDLINEKDKPVEPKRDLDVQKPTKKSKGKAPSPPEQKKNNIDVSIDEQMNNVNDFLDNEKQHSSLLHDSSILSNDRTISSYNTSTPKVNKTKSVSRLEDSINFSQDDIDDIVSKPFKRESDSLNNFYEDSKSNMSSNQDMHSVISLNNSDKSDLGSTTIELNNSDITVHSSPLNDTVRSNADESANENERKATSLGDLSRFELRKKASQPATGALERAQSLDISADDADGNENSISPKKRKANSVVETTFFDSSSVDILPDMVETDKAIINKHKEPRLSLNIAKSSAMEGLNTFQRNRLKKASEFGNLEDAIVKGSSSSLDSDKTDMHHSSHKHRQGDQHLSQEDEHETSDHLAKRIMDENLKVHFKLVSEFAKSTSEGSNMSSLDGSQESRTASPSKSNDNSTAKYEDKMNISYDTNIPDDLKVSRNTYVNSLERPKSDMMKKLLAKNPILNVHVDQASHSKSEPTTSKIETPTPMTDSSKSAIHQPDIVNFDLKPSEQGSDYHDFVSNIRVGSNNNSLKYDKKPLYDSFMEWTEKAPKDPHSTNIVTITNTNEKPQTSSNEQKKVGKTYTKSIEIGEPNVRHVPDVIEGIKRRADDEGKDATRGSRTLYMEPPSMAITMTQEPVQKTVTVNVAEDEFGNKVITQNIEKVSRTYTTSQTETPLQVEQISFGIMKNPGDLQQLNLEGDQNEEMDKKILQEIKKQNPNMHFTTDEPAFTKTETIILNTQLDEEQAVALMEKIKNDPSFMAQKTPEELSQLGIRIIHDLEDIQNESHDTVEVTKTRYSINPGAITNTQICLEESKHKPQDKKDHITEIQVSTPKQTKQKSNVDKISSRQRAPAQVEIPLTYELDVSLLNDFISNERRYSAKQYTEVREPNRRQSNENINEPKKRHSDFDLPRNSHIKFRTATYESPKGQIVTSTDLENRRQSQLDQRRTFEHSSDNIDTPTSPKPLLLAKPSNIPVKMGDKSKPTGGTSKIPVFMTQKSLSQENLTDKSLSLSRSPPRLSDSTGNIISITSIKSSSKNPSGGKEF